MSLTLPVLPSETGDVKGVFFCYHVINKKIINQRP